MSEQDLTAPVEYRTIPRYVGYRFGSDGSFWSCWEQVRLREPSGGSRGVMTERWTRLYGRPDRNGYILVAPRNAITGRFEGRRLHRLVLEAFVGPCPEGMEARHYPDRNPANNRIENLSWSTHAENISDKEVHGTQIAGEKQWASRLTEVDVAEIRRRFAAGESLSKLSAEFGVSSANVSSICRGKTWKCSFSESTPLRQGKSKPKTLLTREQIEEIRKMRRDGAKYAEIVSRFGIHITTVSKICNYQTRRF